MFSTHVLIRHLWQLEAGVLLHRYQIHVVLLPLKVSPTADLVGNLVQEIKALKCEVNLDFILA
jgi:hypothetical protein